MGGGGLPLIPLYDRSPRPIPGSIGPANFRNDRTDHPVSPEPPVETHTMTLEKERSPRPVLKLIGPTNFFAECTVGGRGVSIFLEVGVADHDDGRGDRFPEQYIVSCENMKMKGV